MEAIDERPEASVGSAEETGRRRRRPPAVLVVILVAVAAVSGAYFVGQKAGGRAVHGLTRSVTGAKVPAGFVSYHDGKTGFSLSYPRTWQVARQPEGDVRLVLGAGGLNSLLVRFIRLEQPVTAGNLKDVKAVTDAIVQGADVHILQQRSITLNGMPGYYYLYTFRDAETGLEGVHAHYFVFRGHKMHMLVFQALPSADFDRFAPTFDRVAESFRTEADAPEAATTSTTGSSTATSAGG